MQHAEVPGPTGEQLELVHGDHRAVVTEVGATLRSYSVGGVEVLDGFAAGERVSAGRGQVLAPWPNRLDGGRYSFGGEACVAPLDEQKTGNAIHGLVRWVPWTVRDRGADTVTLACRVFPQPAYAWVLALEVTYRLSDAGLTVTTRVVNLSEATAPFGLGFHPYLSVGTPTVDGATLTLPARARLTSDERCLPVGREPVSGTGYDFTSPRPVGDTVLDTAYTDLVRDADGLARVVLQGPDGRVVRLWMDQAFGYVMAFTGDTVNPPARRRGGVAVEPMTCPPNALASGTDLIALEPGATWQAAWGIEA